MDIKPDNIFFGKHKYKGTVDQFQVTLHLTTVPLKTSSSNDDILLPSLLLLKIQMGKPYKNIEFVSD